MTEQTAQRTYQGVTVPPDIEAVWSTWDGAAWRKMTWIVTNNRCDYPDQRFTVHAPGGMCGRHLEMRRKYRDMYFDDRAGNRWPGTAGSPFTLIDRDTGRELAWRRAEWDEKAGEQMREIEQLCLAGTSQQCQGEPRTCKGCARMACTCEDAPCTSMQ
jgi:hypothetical protein